MRFRVLGSLRVWDGTAWSPVRAAQQRIVLAVLLASAGRVVATERLVDELWGERPPPSAVVTVQGYVRRLRRLLGPAADDLLVTRGHGYELVVGDEGVDAAVFESLVAAGKRAMAEGRFPVAATHFHNGLELWRGPAFADVLGSETVAAEAARLERVRLGTLEEKLGVELELGRHAEVVDELRRLAGQHPTRERLWAQLMTALYRGGRRADALAAYQDASRALAATLGLEPGPELHELRRRVLTDDPPLSAARAPVAPAAARMVPAQLPADVAGFTGREAHLHRLDAMAARGAGTPVLVISTIAGSAGVGKTALAVRWAHRVRDRFPDGQLYVDLRGYAAGPPLRPIDALATFLSALGVPAEEIPTEEERAAALFRSLLADTRTLVVLDNANSPDQVRPLLPAGDGCLVLVTSRDQLRGLAARDGAVRVDLDVLDADEARALLARLLGTDRAQPETLVELARLCGYLPLALRIAAANLAADPERTIAEYTARLHMGDRLSALRADGDQHTAVRVAFDQSYAALPAPARRLFRLLGLVPGPDLTAPAAAALAGIEQESAARMLDLLTGAHLIGERAPGRFTLHDLIRHYAADRAEAEDSRESAMSRLFDHYLRSVDAAARLLYPHIVRVPPPGSDASAGFEDHAQAQEWLDAERANLVAAVHHASTLGPRSAAWRLADALRGYFYLRGHTVDWEVVAHDGLAAAEADGDPRGRAASHLNVATWQWIRDRHRQAIEHYTPALALSRQVGWVECESTALGGLGAIYAELGRLPQAVDHYIEALAINRRLGWLSGQSIQLGNLGSARRKLGQLELAAEHLTESVALARRTGSHMDAAKAMTNLGEVYQALGRFDDALDQLTQALAVHREFGDRTGEAEALRLLAAVHRDAGRPTEALDLAGTALDLSRECDDRQVRAESLATLAGIHLYLGQHEQAIAGHIEALDIANPHLEVEALIGLATAYRRTGDIGRATDCAHRALTTATAAGYRVREGQARTALAAVHLRDGNHGQAIELAERAVAIQSETGHRLGQAQAHLVAAHALSRAGRDSEARTHQERAHVLFAEIGTPLPEHGLRAR